MDQGGKAVPLIQAHQAWVAGRLVSDVVVEVSGGTISRVDTGVWERVPGAVQADTLLPGLINSHCHLEYTHLRGKLPRGQVPFGTWMSAIMGSRQTDQTTLEEGMRKGARELLRGGCTYVIDSTTDGASGRMLEEAGLGHTLMFEVLGLTEDRAQDQWEGALKRLERAGKEHGAGLNPHAPYSVGPWLREKLRQSNRDVPVAWHLAETPDEEELFRSASGSIAELFRRIGLPMPWQGETPPGCSPYEFLARAKLLDRVDLIFHGNTLSPSEARHFQGERGLVHCPGTHRWFQRPRFPLRELLDDGVRVCLGTDSLASSDTLSMLEVMRMVAADHPDVTPAETLAMATSSAGGLPLVKGNGPSRGHIAPGFAADFSLLTGPWETGRLENVIISGSMNERAKKG